MTDAWKKHCPYDIEEQPACRRAWREGWFYRKDHGRLMPTEEIERKMERRLLFSSWLQGYNGADDHLLEPQTEARK